MKKKFKWLGLIVVLLVIVLGAAELYFYNVAFVPSHKDFLGTNKVSHEEKLSKKWLEKNSTVWHQKSATDNLKLVADYVPAKKKTGKTVVVAHGFMGKKEDQAQQIRMFHNLGYNVLAPDDRAHGQSEGKVIGYGWLDKDDYAKWINKVIKHNGKKSQIALYGVSMGGATVMMTSGINLPSQVKAIIEDCGYTSLKDELFYEAGVLYKAPPVPLVRILSWVAIAKAGYNLYDASSVKQLQNNHLPVFFIHGDKDTFVPTKMVYKNYHATKGPKKLWVAKNAKHAETFKDYPKEYERKVEKFLNNYIR